MAFVGAEKFSEIYIILHYIQTTRARKAEVSLKVNKRCINQNLNKIIH